MNIQLVFRFCITAKHLSSIFHHIIWVSDLYFITSSVFTEEIDKAYVLDMFFKSQTILNEDCVVLPDIQAAQVDTEFDRIFLTPQESQPVLEILPLGKASSPNGLNNRILREFITKTSPYNEDRLTPHFYILKLGFTGVCIIFFILL